MDEIKGADMFIQTRVFSEDVAYCAEIAGKEFQGKNVLITGACGMIGTMLCHAFLRAGAVVYGLDISEERARKRFLQWMEESRFVFVEHDITEPLILNSSVDFIIHAASNAYPKAFELDPTGTMLQNFTGVKYLLDFATKSMARLLYVSSGEVYGEGNGTDFEESYSGFIDILNPRACYPSAKRASETLCASYHTQYGTDVVIVRPSHIYGLTATEADTRAATQFLRAGAAGKDIVMKSKGEQVRSYTYIADCVAGMIFVLKNGISGEAYNIANEKSVVSIREVAEIIAEICDVRIRFELPDDAEQRSFNPVTRSVLSSKKLKALGFEGKYDIYGGVERTVRALKRD